MRHKVHFDRKINKFAVLDAAAANQPIGLHDDFEAAFKHAEAEERLCQQFGAARHAAEMYQRQRETKWVA